VPVVILLGNQLDAAGSFHSGLAFEARFDLGDRGGARQR